MTDLFTGQLVRLAAQDIEKYSQAFHRWGHDSEYLRLLSSDPARRYSVKGTQAWLERLQENKSVFSFGIHTLEDDRLIGDVGLDGVNWHHRESFVGIGIGSREDWGKGYGTDAMRVILRYAFTELNLYRVSLNVFEYNERAIRSYEKAGFTVEGRLRQYMHRDGRRWDVVFMGILQPEWEKLEGSK
jgi:RimJ/RimL family protein N-acetyltransferase